MEDPILIIFIIFSGLYSVKKHSLKVNKVIKYNLLAMFVCFVIGVPVVIYDFIIYLRNKLKKEKEEDINYDETFTPLSEIIVY